MKFKSHFEAETFLRLIFKADHILPNFLSVYQVSLNSSEFTKCYKISPVFTKFRQISPTFTKRFKFYQMSPNCNNFHQINNFTTFFTTFFTTSRFPYVYKVSPNFNNFHQINRFLPHFTKVY